MPRKTVTKKRTETDKTKNSVDEIEFFSIFLIFLLSSCDFSCESEHVFLFFPKACDVFPRDIQKTFIQRNIFLSDVALISKKTVELEEISVQTDRCITCKHKEQRYMSVTREEQGRGREDEKRDMIPYFLSFSSSSLQSKPSSTSNLISRSLKFHLKNHRMGNHFRWKHRRDMNEE